MLKISLTDGKTTIHGVEITKLEGINLNTLPGTKVKVADSVPISNGFLRLEPGTLKVLGGRVESLIEKWETSQKMAKFTRNFARNQPSVAPSGAESTSEGPPMWIPFGKRIGKFRQSEQNQPEADKNFKALPARENSEENSTKENNAEFDSQRQDAIKEITAKGGSQKVFGGGTKEIKEGKSERRGGRGGRGRDNNRAANGHENSEENSQDNKGKMDKLTCSKRLEYLDIIHGIYCEMFRYYGHLFEFLDML